VTKIDASRNAIIVGKEEDLFSRELEACDVNWIANPDPPRNASRYQNPLQCKRSAWLSFTQESRYGESHFRQATESRSTWTIRSILRQRRYHRRRNHRLISCPVAILTVLLDASAPEVTLVNRFWKTVIAGTAVGAVIGVYLYAKSKEDRKRLMAEDSRAQEMASKWHSESEGPPIDLQTRSGKK